MPGGKAGLGACGYQGHCPGSQPAPAVRAAPGLLMPTSPAACSAQEALALTQSSASHHRLLTFENPNPPLKSELQSCLQGFPSGAE